MRQCCVIFPFDYMTLKLCQYFVMEVGRMTDNKARFTLRVDPELLEKLGYPPSFFVILRLVRDL